MNNTHLVVNQFRYDNQLVANTSGIHVFPDWNTLIQSIQGDLSNVLCDAQVLLYVSPQDVIKDENMSQLESQKLLPKAIISTGTGMDHIQISDSLKDQLGLVINSMPYRSRYHTVLVTLSLLNEIYGTELSAQHISIVGMGIIGQGLASSLAHQAKSIIPYSTRSDNFDQDKSTIGSNSDIIILCTSLQEANKHMITAELLDTWLLGKTALHPLMIINIGRAGHIHPSCYDSINKHCLDGRLRWYSDVEPDSQKSLDTYVYLDYQNNQMLFSNVEQNEQNIQSELSLYIKLGIPGLSHKLMGTAGAMMIHDSEIKQAYKKYMISRMKQLETNRGLEDKEAVEIPREMVKQYPFLGFIKSVDENSKL